MPGAYGASPDVNQNDETHSILRSVKEQEEQFEQLTRELELERQSVAQQIERCKFGSETASMNSISETDESYPWRAPTHTSHTSTSGPINTQVPSVIHEESDADSKLSGGHLVDSCLKVLNERSLLNEYAENRQTPTMNNTNNSSNHNDMVSYQGLESSHYDYLRQQKRMVENYTTDDMDDDRTYSATTPYRNNNDRHYDRDNPLRNASFESGTDRRYLPHENNDMTTQDLYRPRENVDEEEIYPPLSRQNRNDSLVHSDRNNPNTSIHSQSGNHSDYYRHGVPNDYGPAVRGHQNDSYQDDDDDNDNGGGGAVGSRRFNNHIQDSPLKRVEHESDVFLASSGYNEPELTNSGYNSSRWNSNYATPDELGINNDNNNDDDDAWRDPDLTQVIDFLKHPSDVIKANSAAYLQHISFNDNSIKQKTRGLGGIKPLIELAINENNDLVRAACGALRNLSYGRENVENKKEIKKYGGLSVMNNILKSIDDDDIREMVTGILWNMSSCDEMKRPIIDQILQTLVDEVIVPHTPDNQRPYVVWTTIFRNASGILRNISSDGLYARSRLRECDMLLSSCFIILESAIGRNDVDNKNVENIVCLLRNLCYACQEVVDSEYNRRKKQHSTAASSSSKSIPSGCFGKSKKSNDNRQLSSILSAPVTGNVQLLWQENTERIFMEIIKDSSNPTTLEAATGAIQNLVACEWNISIEYRTLIRHSKGLPPIVDLIDIQSDLVVRTAVNCLRNLAYDSKNKDLIGIHAMEKLINCLPPLSNQIQSNFQLSNETYAAILATLYEVVKDHTSFSKRMLEMGGMKKVEVLAKNFKYGSKVNKYAVYVWQQMWKIKELHADFKKAGYKESSIKHGGGGSGGGGGGYGNSSMKSPQFTPAEISSTSVGSLHRPRMDQSSHGSAHTLPLVNRPQVTSPNDVRSPSPYNATDRNYKPVGAVSMFPGLDDTDIHFRQQQQQQQQYKDLREPVYAQVRSQSTQPNGGNADSWV